MPEADNNNSEARARSQTPDRPTSRAEGQLRGTDAVIDHISRNKIDFVLAITRMLTVLCTLSYLIGIPGPASSRYKQALLMTAATSSLRLHKRMPPPPSDQLNWRYFMDLIKEDSFHYMIYPFMFFTCNPMTLVLLPCVLFALFNLAVYSITILDKMGNQEALKARVTALIEQYQQSILHTIALSEITMMPMVVIGVLTQAVWFLTPILYYRFLLLRYNSARNAHFKVLVSQIAMFARTQAARYMSR